VGALAVIVVLPVVLLAVAGGRRPRGEDVGLAACGRLGITAAVDDTGLDLEHLDPAQDLRDHPDERDGSGVDDDANGGVDDVRVAVSPTASVTRPPSQAATQLGSAATTRSAARPSP
jgi:hypothetical protein